MHSLNTRKWPLQVSKFDSVVKLSVQLTLNHLNKFWIVRLNLWTDFWSPNSGLYRKNLKKLQWWRISIEIHRSSYCHVENQIREKKLWSWQPFLLHEIEEYNYNIVSPTAQQKKTLHKKGKIILNYPIFFWFSYRNPKFWLTINNRNLVSLIQEYCFPNGTLLPKKKKNQKNQKF